MKANGASIVGDERTTPLFRQVPEEVKRRGLRAAGGGEGCWRTLDHGSAALQWAVVDGGRRGQWGGRSGEARPAPAGSRSQWALPSHLEHPLSIHWAATTGGHPLNPLEAPAGAAGEGGRRCNLRPMQSGKPITPQPPAPRDTVHTVGSQCAGAAARCRGAWLCSGGPSGSLNSAARLAPAMLQCAGAVRTSSPPHHGFDEPPLANTPHSQHAHKRRRP